MKTIILMLLVGILCTPLSWAKTKKFDWGLSGSLDIQYKSLKNTKEAEDADEDWKHSDIRILQSNLHHRTKLWNNILEANWFFRYSASDLYQDNIQFAPSNVLFPDDLMARELFDLKHNQQNQQDRTQSMLNQLSYQWITQEDEASFEAGRIFIDYGEGYFYNPINPFNTPLIMTTLPNTHLGNDGVSFRLPNQKNLTLFIYILGDKKLLEDDDDITRTALLRGDYTYSEKLHLNYILGEDQKRHKYGIELKYWTAEKTFLLTQVVKESKRVDKKDNSEGMTHFLAAIQSRPFDLWSIRLEGGTNDRDEVLGSINPQTRFLPIKHYLGMSHALYLTDLVTVTLNMIVSPQTDLTYSFLDVNHQYSKQLQFHVFAAGITSKNRDKSVNKGLSEQLWLPSQLGLGLRSEF